MADIDDVKRGAAALQEAAEQLQHAGSTLREHPELVNGVVRTIAESIHLLDDVLGDASAAYRDYAATAVAQFGEDGGGLRTALYAGGLLGAAAQSTHALRDTLFRAAAEADVLVWPEHDPVIAEQLHEYRQLIAERAQQITPDREHGSPQAPGGTGIAPR